MPYRGRITEIGASYGADPSSVPAWASFETGSGGLLYDGGIVSGSDDHEGLPLLSAAIFGQDVPPLAYKIPETIVGDAPKKSFGPVTMPTDPQFYQPPAGKPHPYQPPSWDAAPWAKGIPEPWAHGTIVEALPLPSGQGPGEHYQIIGAGATVEEEAASAQAAADAQEAETKKGQLWIWIGAGVALWLLVRG